MQRLVGTALLLLVLVHSTAVGQTRKPEPALVKYGKWALLGVSLGLNILAAHAHSQADDAFKQLENYCFDDQTRCDLGPGGAYKDPVSEGYYQTSVHFDRQARVRLFAGETALLGAGALFVWELSRPKGQPPNIPFEPHVSQHAGRTELGLTAHF